MDRGGWWATVHGVAKSWTRLKRLSTHAECVRRPGQGTDAQGLVGHVRQSNLHPARGGNPRGAFRQVDGMIGTSACLQPTHAPDTSAFSPAHVSRSCQASHPFYHLHPLLPPPAVSALGPGAPECLLAQLRALGVKGCSLFPLYLWLSWED